MIPIVLLFLSIHSNSYPKWEFLLFYQPRMNGNCSPTLGSPELLSKIKKKCESNPNEFGGPQKCNEIIDACAGMKCYNQTEFTNLDNYLSKIDNSIKSVILFIVSTDQVKIDLSKLSTRMQVYIFCHK